MLQENSRCFTTTGYRVQGTGDVEIYEMLECIPHLELIFSYWESFSYLFDMFSLLLYATNEYLILFLGDPVTLSGSENMG